MTLVNYATKTTKTVLCKIMTDFPEITVFFSKVGTRFHRRCFVVFAIG